MTQTGELMALEVRGYRVMTLDEFNALAQMQDDYLHSRGCNKPKEMIVSQSLRKRLNLGDTIILNHAGEIPLIEDSSIPLFMFRGFVYDLKKDTTSLVALKTRTLGPSEVQLTPEDVINTVIPVPSVKAVPMPKVALSQRKRASR